MDRTRVSATLDPAPPRSPACHNCGARLTGPYCSRCGQQDVPLDRRLGQVLRDWLEEVASIDSRLVRTLFTLFFRPGRLSVDYNEGRRVRYVPPLRLYMIASVLFFFVLALVPGVTRVEVDPGETDDTVELGSVRPADAETPPAEVAAGPAPREDATAAPAPGTGLPAAGSAETPDAAREGAPGAESAGATDAPSSDPTASDAADRAGSDATGFDAWMRERGEQVMSDMDGFAHFWIRVLAWSMFVLLPIAALLLAAVYRRPKRYYVQHLVFTLHTHAFAFLVLALGFIVDVWLIGSDPDDTSVAVSIGVIMVALYLYLALLRGYGEGIVRTAFKFCVLGTAYTVALVIVMTASIFVALGLF